MYMYRAKAVRAIGLLKKHFILLMGKKLAFTNSVIIESDQCFNEQHFLFECCKQKHHFQTMFINVVKCSKYYFLKVLRTYNLFNTLSNRLLQNPSIVNVKAQISQ